MRTQQRAWILGLLSTVLALSGLLGPGHHALASYLSLDACQSSHASDDGSTPSLSRSDACPLCDQQSQAVAPPLPTEANVEPAIAEPVTPRAPVATTAAVPGDCRPRAPPLAS